MTIRPVGGSSKFAVRVLCCASLLAMGVSDALACRIENEKRFQEPFHQGIKGTCSNNQEEIRCIEEGDNGFTCTGKGGTFSGSDVNTLIFSACACADSQ